MDENSIRLIEKIKDAVRREDPKDAALALAAVSAKLVRMNTDEVPKDDFDDLCKKAFILSKDVSWP